MSKIYHGSIEEVRNPEIRQPNRSLDYGLVSIQLLLTNRQRNG